MNSVPKVCFTTTVIAWSGAISAKNLDFEEEMQLNVRVNFSKDFIGQPPLALD